MAKPQPEQMNEKLKLLIIVVVILNVLFFGIWYLTSSSGEQNEPEVISQVEENVDLEKCYGDYRKERGTEIYEKCYSGQYDIKKVLKENDNLLKDQSSEHDKEFNELLKGR